MTLPRGATRFAKEVAFLLLTGVLAEIGKDLVLDWMKNRDLVTEEQTVRRDEIAGLVTPEEPVVPSPAPPFPSKAVPALLTEPSPKPAPPPLPSPRNLPQATAYTHVCETPQREKVTFEVVVFAESFSWAYEKVDLMEIGGETADATKFKQILADPTYQDIMGKAQEIIVAGTASCEGTEWRREDDRALERARNLRTWVEGARPWRTDVQRPARSLHVLNLGRYWHDCKQQLACNPAKPQDTWNQRKIILMAILQRDPGLDQEELGWCIEKSMNDDPQLDFLMQHYCRYDLNKDLDGNPI